MVTPEGPAGQEPSGHVHATAIVEDGAHIGAGTRIWHHVHVCAGATIGHGCNLGKNVFVGAGVVIGDFVKLQNNVSIYPGVTLGDEVFVGPGAVITNDHVPRARGAWRICPTRVGRGASIGANATVVTGEVGEWALVAAGAVVTRVVAPHQLVMGNPARLYAWLCRCGAVRVRAGEHDRLTCNDCGTELDIPV